MNLFRRMVSRPTASNAAQPRSQSQESMAIRSCSGDSQLGGEHGKGYGLTLPEQVSASVIEG